MGCNVEALKIRIETITHVLDLNEEYPEASTVMLKGELIGLQHALGLLDGAISTARVDYTIKIPPVRIDAEALARAGIPGFATNVPHADRGGDAGGDRKPASEDAHKGDVGVTEQAYATPCPPPFDPTKKPSNRDRVLQAYRDGHHGRAAIAAATGIKKTSIDTYLSLLRREGAIPRPVAPAVAGGDESTVEAAPAPAGGDREVSPPRGKPPSAP